MPCSATARSALDGGRRPQYTRKVDGDIHIVILGAVLVTVVAATGSFPLAFVVVTIDAQDPGRIHGRRQDNAPLLHGED